VYFYAYDNEYDYPISYQLKRNNSQVAAGSFAIGDYDYKTYQSPDNLTVGKYTIQLA